ncbi:hypothetical protein GOP47_0029001 [Adiantum capillus-veneris]|nr:hypothetical protein GOP47_0029001 [Adiantum capillus-veneris]
MRSSLIGAASTVAKLGLSLAGVFGVAIPVLEEIEGNRPLTRKFRREKPLRMLEASPFEEVLNSCPRVSSEGHHNLLYFAGLRPKTSAGTTTCITSQD